MPLEYRANYGPEHINVDNDPVGVSFGTPNDANPSTWVGHAVTVDATASAGPSGVGGMRCSSDGGAASAYPAAGVAVNGDGVHTVSCTAWNRAVDPARAAEHRNELDDRAYRRGAAVD